MLLASSLLLFRKLMAAIVLLAKIIGPRVDIAMTPRRPQKEPVKHVLVKRQFNFTAKALVDHALHKASSTISSPSMAPDTTTEAMTSSLPANKEGQLMYAYTLLFLPDGIRVSNLKTLKKFVDL